MKIVPLLAVSNALALGLVLLLFLKQGDLESRLESARVPRRDRPTNVDEAAIEARILASLREEVPPAPAGYADFEANGDARVADVGEARATDRSAAAAAGAARAENDLPAGLLAGRPMEDFRQNVRRAQELNRQEDRVKNEVSRLDQLVEKGRIAALDPAVKKTLATRLLGFRDQSREVWGQLRTNPDVRGMSREDRGNYMREKFQTLRDAATKELEKLVQPADAKTIVESSLRSGAGRGLPGRRGGDTNRGRGRGGDGG